LEYGFVSNTLNSPEWHAPVCTVEPLRRLYYDAPGAPHLARRRVQICLHRGYNETLESVTRWLRRLEQWWRIEERHSLLTRNSRSAPESSSARFASPTPIISASTQTISLCQSDVLAWREFLTSPRGGVEHSLRFQCNCPWQWKGSAPLIVLNPKCLSTKKSPRSRS